MASVGSLAQLVEQRTFNPFVVGSTPARPTTKISSENATFRGGVFAFGDRKVVKHASKKRAGHVVCMMSIIIGEQWAQVCNDERS